MYHLVSGSVNVNGEIYDFERALGYCEGDSGYSFTGMIGVVLWQGAEFRFATYLGAKVVENTNGRIRIIQGKMVRTIHESVSCRAFYRFRVDKKTIFAFETERASCEYEY